MSEDETLQSVVCQGVALRSCRARILLIPLLGELNGPKLLVT